MISCTRFTSFKHLRPLTKYSSKKSCHAFSCLSSFSDSKQLILCHRSHAIFVERKSRFVSTTKDFESIRKILLLLAIFLCQGTSGGITKCDFCQQEVVFFGSDALSLSCLRSSSMHFYVGDVFPGGNR